MGDGWEEEHAVTKRELPSHQLCAYAIVLFLTHHYRNTTTTPLPENYVALTLKGHPVLRVLPEFLKREINLRGGWVRQRPVLHCNLEGLEVIKFLPKRTALMAGVGGGDGERDMVITR